MQGKLRGDLGSALPFLPGLFIKLHKLLRSEFCYIAHLMWRLNMSPLIASCIHPQIVPWALSVEPEGEVEQFRRKKNDRACDGGHSRLSLTPRARR